MSDLAKRIANLSPQQYQSLQRKLEERQGKVFSAPIKPRSGDVHFLLLSFSQQRFWLYSQLDPESTAYLLPIAVHISGRLNKEALQASIQQIVRRHEILRTYFVLEQENPCQVIAPAVSLELTEIDLASFAPSERLEEAQRLALFAARQPFDLAHPPLLRTTLYRLDDDDFIFLLIMHHIISDAWSLGIFVHELSLFYLSFVAGQQPRLPELPVQYADYALWQREWLTGRTLDEQLAYWQKQLAGLSPGLLPADFPRSSRQTHRAGQLDFAFPGDLLARLHSWSQQEGITLFMALVAAFQVLLARYSGQRDIAVGTSIANRAQIETESLIGLLVNILVLRTNMQGNPTSRSLVKQVREVCLGAYAHQDLPFEKLVEALHPAHDPGMTPFFQAFLMLNNTPTTPLTLPDLTLEPIKIPAVVAEFDLAVNLYTGEAGAGFGGTVIYNADLFRSQTIRQMLRHYQGLLEQMAANPHQLVFDLPLLDQEERLAVLLASGAIQTPQVQPLCLHQLFERQVALIPDALAVAFGEEQVTYHALNARANQLAWFLRKQGAGPEVYVGLFFERSISQLICLLAVMKAGGAYIPLDPGYPRERLAFLLADAHPRLLLTCQQLSTMLPPFEGEVYSVDSLWDLLAGEFETNPDYPMSIENTAYIIYTSGSTGTPKGVAVEHKGLCNLAEAQCQAFAAQPTDRVLQFAPLSFDASVSEIAMTWAARASLHLGTRESMHPGPVFLQLLRNQAITMLTLPPSILAALPERSFPTVRTVICAGESCTADLVARWGQQVQLFNAYGPTENTVCASIAACSALESSLHPPVGFPLANTQVLVLDEYMQLVPPGVYGEIYLGGTGLARGYINRPDLTAERFVPHPYSSSPGARLYRTGDQGRYLADGQVECTGRLDRQLKVRGYRIEPGEIEAVLNTHQQVLQSVVTVHQDDADKQRLIAYVVPQPQELPDKSELRSYLQGFFPDFMLPSAYIFLDHLPLSPHGKIDWRALPTLASMDSTLRPDIIAPRTPVEQMIADIWRQVLDVKNISIHDSFFELGGHSLLAIQVLTRLQAVVQHDLPLSILFTSPTLETLAQSLIAEETVPGQIETIAQIYLEVAQMSENEIEARLEDQ